MRVTAIGKFLGCAAFLVLCTSSASGAVIISQYYEGASNNKFIELFNTGPTSVDLAAGSYQISLWSNTFREGWKTDVAPNGTLALTGTIPAGGTHVLSHGSAALPAYAVPADQTSNTAINFNGDDSVGLWTGTTFSTAALVDVFGATANNFADLSYVRNSSILSGSTTDFNSADWTLYTLAEVAGAASDAPEYLGFHAVVPEPTTFVLLGLAGVAMVSLVRRRS